MCLQVVVNFPLKPMNHENKKVVEAAISGISAGGGTNLSGGLFKGIDQLQQSAMAEQAIDTSGMSNKRSNPVHAAFVQDRCLQFSTLQPLKSCWSFCCTLYSSTTRQKVCR